MNSLLDIPRMSSSSKITIKARLDRERSKFGYLSDDYDTGFVEIKINPKEPASALVFAACEKFKGQKPVIANLKKDGSEDYLNKKLSVAENDLKNGDKIVVECHFRAFAPYSKRSRTR